MRALAAFICIWLCLSLPTFGQTEYLPDRKKEIEKIMENISSFAQFQYVAKELAMTIEELSDYPVLFPVKRNDYTNYVSSGYGRRLHPIKNIVQHHTGIDIAEAKGNPVFATGNGIVVSAGWKSGYGNFVEVKHTAGFTSFYAHLDEILVSIGDHVVLGEHIACVGNTGLSTGSHLHYEVRKNGKFMNAEQWCWGMAKTIY